MSDVENLNEHRNNKIKEGEQVFFACGCTPGGANYCIQVIKSAEPLVTKLICSECGDTYEVNNGKINI